MELEEEIVDFLRGERPEDDAAARVAMQHAWEGTREALEGHGYTFSEGPNWDHGMVDGCFLTPSGAVIGICIEWARPQQND
jgi:hypothetical protein